MATLLLTFIYPLAVFRLTNLLYNEGGPFHIFDHVRAFLRRWEMTGEMIECPLCISVWASGLMGLVYLAGLHWIAVILAWSGVVCLIFIGLEMGWQAVKRQGPARFNQDTFKARKVRRRSVRRARLNPVRVGQNGYSKAKTFYLN